MAIDRTKVPEDSMLRFLRVVHENGLNLREGDSELSAPRRLTQVAVAQQAGLSRPSVASYTERAGVVLHKNPLTVEARSGYAIGVDIGEIRGARVALSDISGQILQTISAEEESAQLQPQTAEEALDFIENAVRRLLEEYGVREEQIVGVGVSLPGPVSEDIVIGRDAGVWRNLSAANELSRRLRWEHIPFETQSDTYLSALAENLWDGGHLEDHTLYIKWAARLRAAIVIDGKVYTGHSGTAGELPHQVVKGLEDLPPRMGEAGLMDRCPVCHESGCLHQIASLSALSKAITGSENQRASLLVEIARRESDDGEARQILNIAARGIGEAAAPLVNALDPEAVVIGGALGSRAFPLVFEALTEPLARGGGVTVRGGRLEQRTAVRGAVALALLEFSPSYLRRAAE